MNDESSHSLLRDYAQTLLRRKWVVVAVILLGALVAGSITFLQQKTFSAEAALAAQNPAQESGLVGLLQSNQTLPQETSAQLAQIAVNTAVIARVKTTLHLPQTIDDIRSNISVSQDQQSDFVLIDATASTAAGAAALANATANAVVYVSNSQIQAQFAGYAVQQQKQADGLLAPFAHLKFGSMSAAQQQEYTTTAAEAQQLAGVAARLQAFSRVVTVAQVTSPASPPSSASSPHALEAILIGAIAGLVLSLLLVWLLESIDRRLRRPDETERLMGLPIVGAVSEGALGEIPGGEAKDAAPISSFRMLRTNVRFLASKDAEPPRTVLVTSALPEEGKTTVAIGLALAAASGGLNTLLIEADVHRPVHAKRLGLATGPGLAEYLADGVPPARILQVHQFTDAAAHANGASGNGRTPKLTCITAGDVSSFTGDAIASSRFSEMMAEVHRVYDLVVIDSAPLLAVAETSEMVRFVDAIVFCVRMGRTTVEQVKAARTALERLPSVMAGLVLTDLVRQLGGYYGYGGYGYDQASGSGSKRAEAAV